MLALGALVPLLNACLPDLGDCDAAAARELVFRDTGDNVDGDNGLPMYAGQALVQQSCGDGAFCHAEAAQGTSRYGASHVLDFDLSPACTGFEAPCQAGDPITDGLRANRQNAIDHAQIMLQAIDRETMPPPGVGADVVSRAPSFRRVDFLDIHSESFELRSRVAYCDQLPIGTCAPGATTIELENPLLPPVGSSEGREIVRNWLACGAPVVESAIEAANLAHTGWQCAPNNEAGHVGDCFVRIPAPVTPPDPTWSSIFTTAILPGCGTKCHSPSDPAHFRDSHLDLSTSLAAYQSLIDGVASGSTECVLANWSLLVPNDPDRSLFLRKMEHTAGCGDAMGTFPPAVTDVIRAWIAAGAQLN